MKKKKIIGEVNIVSELAQERGKTLANFYDKMLLDSFMQSGLAGDFGLIKYRKQRVPIYLTIKIPIFEKHYCYDNYDDDDSGSAGYLMNFKAIKLFKIGSRIEKVPYYPNKTLRFRRYGKLI